MDNKVNRACLKKDAFEWSILFNFCGFRYGSVFILNQSSCVEVEGDFKGKFQKCLCFDFLLKPSLW